MLKTKAQQMIELMDIKVEENTNFQPDKVTLICGSSAYKRLFSNAGVELRKCCRELNDAMGIETCWTLSARFRNDSKLVYMSNYNDGNVAFSPLKKEAVIFFSYVELKECSDALLESNNFEEIVVHESMRLVPKMLYGVDENNEIEIAEFVDE